MKEVKMRKRTRRKKVKKMLEARNREEVLEFAC